MTIKMKFFCIIIILINKYQFALCRHRWVNWQAPWIEQAHDPTRYQTPKPRVLKTYSLPSESESPDYRVDEDPNAPWIKPDFYREEHRAYRLSPSWKMIVPWQKFRPEENIHHSGCYCTTVYKRLTPLAGCAVITTRHLLTTATSTHLILRDRLNYRIMEGILGAWYDTNHDNMNSSMYLEPARIHYHPLWHYPEQVNRTHPFSFTFDLAVWATTYTIFGWYFNNNSAKVCLRSTSNTWGAGSPAPSGTILYIIVGYQFMLAFNRKPMPWFKYGVRTWSYTEPCPKTEWGWFICIPGNWATFGIESGAPLHRSFVGTSWQTDGLIGMAAFSMKLRSGELTHYFTILDCYPVLDFIYDAYRGFLPFAWKDARFEDTKYHAPELKRKYWIYRDYRIGSQWPYDPIYFY